MKILFMTANMQSLVRKNIITELEKAINNHAMCAWAGLNYRQHRFEPIEDTMERIYEFERPDWVVYFPWKHEEQGRWDNIPLDWIAPKDRDFKVALCMGDLPNAGTMGFDYKTYCEAINEVAPDAVLMEYLMLGGIEDPAYYVRNLDAPICYVPPHMNERVVSGNIAKIHDIALLGNRQHKVYTMRKLWHNALPEYCRRNGFTYLIKGRPPGRSDLRNMDLMKRAGFLVGDVYLYTLAQTKAMMVGVSEYGYPLLKIWEAMISRSVAVSNPPYTARFLGLEDGENYVEVDKHNWREKLKAVLIDKDFRKKIVNNAYNLVMDRHTTPVRAKEVFDFLDGYQRLSRSQLLEICEVE